MLTGLYRCVLLFFLLLSCAGFHTAIAQQLKYQADNSIEVYANNTRLPLAWCGGVNNPQFALADLNRDGKKDLVIYEQGSGVKTFLNTGIPGKATYTYAPLYEKYFPEVKEYLKLIDYNNDNTPDLVHRGNTGFSIYKGYYGGDNRLRFRFYTDLYYRNANGQRVNAYCEPNDIPDIADVDGDGDLDFFSYAIGGGYVSFYRNCRVEEGLPADSIKICLNDNCWGKVYQSYERKQILGSVCSSFGTSSCKGCDTPSYKTTHAGNTLCLLDYDGDGDYDYFNGNNAFPDIQYLKNGRQEYSQPKDSMVVQDTVWSTDGTAVQNLQWPAAFWLDIDGDGDRDLLFSPHARGTANYNCTYYYQNAGSTNSPSYIYQSDTFFTAQMIDAGTGAYPVLYDYNKDGKKDLFIGSQGYFQPQTGTLRSRISYYENTSANGQVSFTLRNNDFLDINALNISGAIPAIGDINRDGKDDLILGKLDGKLIFYINTATTENEMPRWEHVGLLLDADSKEINVGGFATPCIYDMDKDGYADLVIGNLRGTLVYYRNIGAGNVQPMLTYQTDKLGGVSTATAFSTYGYSAPFIGKLDDTGKDYLLLGSQAGELYRYDGLQNGNTTAPFTRLDSFYKDIDPGTFTAPAVADLDGDGLYEILTGTVTGGVKLFRLGEVEEEDGTPGDGDVKDITIFPNPATNSVIFSWTPAFIQGDLEIRIFSATGQQVLAYQHTGPDAFVRFDLGGFSSGIYYCKIISGNNRVVKPLSVVR